MAFDDKVPIYFQIEQQIQHQIIRGELKPGDRVPAVRQLAVTLTVNVNTVQRALANLVQRGILVSERGKGNFVTADVQCLQQMKHDVVQQELTTMVQRLTALGMTRVEMQEALADYLAEQEESTDGDIKH